MHTTDIQQNTPKKAFFESPIDQQTVEKYLIDLKAGKPSEIKKESSKVLKYIQSLNEKNKEQRFTFIDLFAGVGGMRLGFEAHGGKCVMTSEVDQKALATYFCNFGEMVPENLRDITKINEKEVPEHDILLGGFPCQAFSIAGERKGFQDTRGTLFFDIERIIEAKRPKAILLENVKGLLNHNGGKTYQTIEKILSDKLGYKVSYKVMNTMEYGNVPQTRERVYIVGIRKDLVHSDFEFSFPEPIKLTKKISNMLQKKQSDENLYYDRFDIHTQLKKEIKKTDTIYQWRRVYVRENKSNACPTLTANMGTGGHNVPLIKEKETGRIRKLSPRECANFQGFPKNYYIPKFMANSHLYKQFGNSVSVPVLDRVCAQILASVDLQTTMKKHKILN